MISRRRAARLVEKERLYYNRTQEKFKERDFNKFKKLLFKEIKSEAKRGHSFIKFDIFGLAAAKGESYIKLYEVDKYFEKLKNTLIEKGYKNIDIEEDRIGDRHIKVIYIDFEDKVKVKFKGE